MDPRLSRAWAEINLNHIAHNFGLVKAMTKPKTKIMAVIKSNAYGHGAVPVARALVANGADALAVATLDEAIELRKNDILSPIQILGHTAAERAGEIVDYRLAQTVFHTGLAKAISREAVARQSKATVHIKLNTGMNRVGFIPGDEARRSIRDICEMPGLCVEGIMTHFSSADRLDTAVTYRQFDCFMDEVAFLESNGIRFAIKHVCNSASLLRFPDMHLDMVRPGIILYGHSPSAEMQADNHGFLPVMSLKARVVYASRLPLGAGVGYGSTYIAKEDRLIAAISAGYGDGFPRRLSNMGRVLVRGTSAPIVGAVCMDVFTADITDCQSAVSTGDEVVLFGRQGEKEITVEEIAGMLGTVQYEILCNIGLRVPRVYIKDGIIFHAQE